MKIKVRFKDHNKGLDLKGVGVAIKEQCLMVYPNVGRDPSDPDVDIYPLDTIEEINIREEKAEPAEREEAREGTVVPIRRN